MMAETLYEKEHPTWAKGPIVLPREENGIIYLFDRLRELDLPVLCALARELSLGYPPPDTPRGEVEFATAAVLQPLWYFEVTGKVPQSVEKSRAEWTARYKRVLEAVEKGDDMSKATGTKTKVKKEAKPKIYLITRYNVTAKDGAKLLNKENKSHNAVLYRTIAAAKEPPTTEEIFASVDKREYSSSAKDATVNMRWHLQDLRNKGFIKSADKKEEQVAA